MVYAFNGAQERLPMWNNLRRISHLVNGPWAVVGDFNCILSASEWAGGYAPSSKIEPFREFVGDCGMLDISSVGSLFTWNNKQRPEDKIYSRIDRFMINKEWSDHMPKAFAHFLPEGLYDHTPYIVSHSQTEHRKHSFRYFNMWGSSEIFCPLIRQNWIKDLPGSHMFKLTRNLKRLKPVLEELNRERFSDIEQSTTTMEHKVRKLQEEIGQNPSLVQLIDEEHRTV
ncbi:hypothetical protein vseg_011702 [Gypsophila vaccaria]